MSYVPTRSGYFCGLHVVDRVTTGLETGALRVRLSYARLAVPKRR